MGYYRLFILDQDDNLVTGVDLRGESDEEALEWTGFVLQAGRIGELWCGTRRVGRVTSTAPVGSAAGLGLGLRFTSMFAAGQGPAEQGGAARDRTAGP
jgi:hypothetical protein